MKDSALQNDETPVRQCEWNGGVRRGGKQRKNLFVSPPTKLLSQVSREGVGGGEWEAIKILSRTHSALVSPLSADSHSCMSTRFHSTWLRTHVFPFLQSQEAPESRRTQFCSCFSSAFRTSALIRERDEQLHKTHSHICLGSWLVCTLSPAHHAGSTPCFWGSSLWRSLQILGHFFSKKQNET